MDNNILYSDNYDETINKISKLGFGIENNKIKKNNVMKYYIDSLTERISTRKKYDNLLDRVKQSFVELKFTRIAFLDRPILESVINQIANNDDSSTIKYILENKDFIIDFFWRYNYHPIKRFVDFNQGLDARLFTNEKSAKMAKIAINPCRIAFDHLDTQKEYFEAMENSVQNGITKFSNYLLYNFEEKPEVLWERLHLNILFCKEHPNINLFSFPMKYAAIDQTDRSFVGQHWSKKYLRAINIILNVTRGIVAKEEDFFLRAYGMDEFEFIEILTMPDEFIRHRNFFEKNGLKQLWKQKYLKLSIQEKNELLEILNKSIGDPDILNMQYSKNIQDIILYYSIRKRMVISNELYYSNLVNSINKENQQNA